MTTAPENIAARAAVTDIRRALSELLAAERRLRGREKKRESDITVAQLVALRAIERSGETTAGELARAAGLNPATVTAMLDQLERAAIVIRTRSRADRRVVLVSLTEQGQKLLDEKTARWDELWATTFGGRRDSELKAAARSMQKIATMLDGLFQD